MESHAVDGCFTCHDKFNEGDDITLVNHIRQDHLDCPLCKRECGDDFNEHLYKVHCFESDESCNDFCDEDLSHCFNSHQWVRCPYPKYELTLPKGAFGSTLMKNITLGDA
jgi:hypothetical protein